MNIPADMESRFAEFPPELRELVIFEMQAGNAIVAIANGDPAAPCGAHIQLQQAVKPERRRSTNGVVFFERHCAKYFGEFTTAERYFFVIEPPRPSEPIADMDAIRAELVARERASDEARFRDTYY